MSDDLYEPQIQFQTPVERYDNVQVWIDGERCAWVTDLTCPTCEEPTVVWTAAIVDGCLGLDMECGQGHRWHKAFEEKP